jgi:hypothetical protein
LLNKFKKAAMEKRIKKRIIRFSSKKEKRKNLIGANLSEDEDKRIFEFLSENKQSKNSFIRGLISNAYPELINPE